MLKKTISIHALSTLLLLGGLSFTQTSCTQTEQREVSQDSDAAYNDFKGFVDQTEAKATSVGNQTQAEFDQETAQMKADFDSKVAAVDQYADQYDDQRRQEIEQLRNRYTTAYDNRETAYRSGANTGSTADGSSMDNSSMDDPTEVGKYYKPTRTEIPTAMTAQNARSKYESFVQMIKQNEDQYDISDWRNINADWRAMDRRYDQIKGDISTGDRAEIAKEKLKYAAFKSYDKAESRVSQGADLVTGNGDEARAKGEGVQIGRSASNAATDVKNEAVSIGKGAANVGKDVGQGAASVGKDVGQGAANVGKDVYKGAKKGVKKVGNAVENVFDGKDNKNN